MPGILKMGKGRSLAIAAVALAFAAGIGLDRVFLRLSGSVSAPSLPAKSGPAERALSQATAKNVTLTNASSPVPKSDSSDEDPSQSPSPVPMEEAIAAIQTALTLPESDTKVKALENAARKSNPETARAILQFVDGLPDDKAKAALRPVVVRRWVLSEPEAALDYV